MNKKLFILLIAVIVILILIISFLVFKNTLIQKQKGSSGLIEHTIDSQKTSVASTQSTEKTTQFLLLKDNNSVEKINLFVSKEGISALPSELLVNYQNLFITDKNGTSYSLDNSGYWLYNMPFILLLVPYKNNFMSESLGSFNTDSPIYIYNDNKKEEYIPLSIIEKPLYYEFNINSHNDSIISQKGKIVGWIFAQTGKGYLIKKDLIKSKMMPNISLTIASLLSNNEKFHELELNPLEDSNYNKIINILSYFENSQNPPEFQKKITNLITLTIKKGEEEKAYSKILSLLPPDILIKTKSEFFLTQLSIALKNSYGFDGAISCLNNFLIMNNFPENLKIKDNEIVLNLYIQYIENSIKNHNLTLALQVYTSAIEQFPYNPKLLLLGSEIYFSLDDMKSAKETLLKIKNSDTNEKYSQLLQKINEKLSDQNKIVAKIEENDHNNIVLSGILNGSIYQKFILDTGASIVTLPSATANSLGLYNLPYRVRTIATASGVVQAREVILQSLTINGKITYNIPVVILDLPAQEGLGLLGMSFLHRFHIELNGQQKELLLTPVNQ